jgi:hypothetical protein
MTAVAVLLATESAVLVTELVTIVFLDVVEGFFVVGADQLGHRWDMPVEGLFETFALVSVQQE